MSGNRCRKIPAACAAAAIAARRLLRGASCGPEHHVFWHTGPSRGTATPQRSAAAAGPLVAGCHRGPAGQAAARTCSFDMQTVQRQHGPAGGIERATPLSVKTGGCPERPLPVSGEDGQRRPGAQGAVPCAVPSFAGRHRPCAVPMGRPLAGRRIRGHRPKRRQCAPGGPNGWPMRGGCRAGSAHRPRAAWSDCFP